MKRDTLEIAREAADFARKEILKGSTQVENNNCEPNQQLNYLFAVDSVRELMDRANQKDPFRLEKDPEIHFFMRTTAISSKYSLGNCAEMSFQALRYMVKKVPEIRAELYNIENGDHVFLVIGHNKVSMPRFPNTWGKEAVICDPWSNKVYPAHEYKTHLKDFSQDVTLWEVKNNIHDFQLGVHRIAPRGFCRSRTLVARNNKEYIDDLVIVYRKKMQIMIDALVDLNLNLVTMGNSIESKTSQKYRALIAKEDQIKGIIESLEQERDYEHAFDDYDQADEILRQGLKDAVTQLGQSFFFSKQDYSALKSRSLFQNTHLARFFGKPREATFTDINTAFQGAGESIKNMERFKFN